MKLSENQSVTINRIISNIQLQFKKIVYILKKIIINSISLKAKLFTSTVTKTKL